MNIHTCKRSQKSKSDHPEAVLKRQRLANSQQSRRKHNFASRQYLTSTDPYTIPIDRANTLLNTNIHPNIINLQGTATTIPTVHELHSENVKRLDANTTADEVVRAIKRAQNLHDLHDVAEIAHFLVEEVGKYLYYIDAVDAVNYIVHILTKEHLSSKLLYNKQTNFLKRPFLRLRIQRLPPLTSSRGSLASKQHPNSYTMHHRTANPSQIIHAAIGIFCHR